MKLKPPSRVYIDPKPQVRIRIIVGSWRISFRID